MKLMVPHRGQYIDDQKYILKTIFVDMEILNFMHTNFVILPTHFRFNPKKSGTLF